MDNLGHCWWASGAFHGVHASHNFGSNYYFILIYIFRSFHISCFFYRLYLVQVMGGLYHDIRFPLFGLFRPSDPRPPLFFLSIIFFWHTEPSINSSFSRPQISLSPYLSIHFLIRLFLPYRDTSCPHPPIPHTLVVPIFRPFRPTHIVELVCKDLQVKINEFFYLHYNCFVMLCYVLLFDTSAFLQLWNLLRLLREFGLSPPFSSLF